MAKSPQDWIAAAVAAAVLTIVFTWPLAPQFDGRFSVWNVAWVSRALTSRGPQLYDANIFYPYRNTLAFSEPNILAGVIGVPAWLATRDALATNNWVTLCSFVLSFLAMFALASRVAGTKAAATLAATLFAFSAYTLSHLPHIQLLLTFGLPLSLLALHAFVERPGPRAACALGGALFVQALACGYYGIFAALAVAWGLVWFGGATGRWRQWAFWGWAAVAAALAAAAIWPFFAPMLAVRAAGFSRTLDDARLFSADWRAYLASPFLIYEWMLPLLGRWSGVLFPGFLALVLTAAAVARTYGPLRRTSPIASRAMVGYYLTLGGMALWASFGPNAGLYRALYALIPAFSLLRAARRFGVLVTLATAVLAGVGLADLQRHSGATRRSVIVLVILTCALVRSSVGPLDLTTWNRRAIVYQRLAQMPVGPVAEFPFFADAADRHRQTEYMLASTLHWQPLINGYSDFFPDQAFRDMLVLSRFPDEASWDVLRRRGARYVVMHWNMYPAGQSPHEFVRGQLVGRYLRTIVDRDDARTPGVLGDPVYEPDFAGILAGQPHLAAAKTRSLKRPGLPVDLDLGETRLYHQSGFTDI
jgi:hypothetical protein